MQVFAKRRKQLINQIEQNSIVILASGQEIIRNGDSHYPFRQQSDFYYLTGFNEPNAILVLIPKHVSGRMAEAEFILFSESQDPEKAIWEGPRAGQEGAKQIFLADQAFAITEFEKQLPSLLINREVLYYPLGMSSSFDNYIFTALNQIRHEIRTGATPPIIFKDVTEPLHEMRLIKDETEINLMKKAASITAKAHCRAMAVCRPSLFEYELEAEILREFYQQGACSVAYSSIVGAGENTCTLHYVANNKQIKSGDLVLIDAGAEYENYAADVTRTFPANGIFTGEQRVIYDLVLAAQLAAINTIKPGASWNLAQQTIIQILVQGLVDLKILEGDVNHLIEQKAYLPFYMHNSGHWLGLDVHDAGKYKINQTWRALMPGQVLTIEPGLYLSPRIPNLPARWHNIGIRIEDDILVTEEGYCVLSEAAPKDVLEIEALMRA
jgi:Xaa-Pro aminopeptidase